MISLGIVSLNILMQNLRASALASTDLHILSDYRGKGIMKTIDNYVRSKNNIIISFNRLYCSKMV